MQPHHALLLAALVACPVPALAQEGDALCELVASAESLEHTPASLDAPLATGTAGAGPVILRTTVEANAEYLVLAAVDHGSVTSLTVSGCDHDRPSTDRTKATLDATNCHAGPITVTLRVARGTRYALGLWRLDRSHGGMLAMRPQTWVIGCGIQGDIDLNAPPRPRHLPACIRRRTARAAVDGSGTPPPSSSARTS